MAHVLAENTVPGPQPDRLCGSPFYFRNSYKSDRFPRRRRRVPPSWSTENANPGLQMFQVFEPARVLHDDSTRQASNSRGPEVDCPRTSIP